MKTGSPIYVKNSKRQYFQIFLYQGHTLVLCAPFLCTRSGAQVKLRARKIVQACPNIVLHLKCVQLSSMYTTRDKTTFAKSKSCGNPQERKNQKRIRLH